MKGTLLIMKTECDSESQMPDLNFIKNFPS